MRLIVKFWKDESAATAIEYGASVFLTGDRTLSRCTQVTVEVL